jgi:sarcosine oxidase subunit gamma
MADLAALRQGPAVPGSAFLRVLPPQARFILRGGADVVSAAGSAIGFVIDQTPCRASQTGSRAVLWHGPDEYLLLAADADAHTLQAALNETLAPTAHSLVDVSHRQMALQLDAPQAADILNSGCPLDLDLAAFPVRMCTRTLLAKADIVLWRTAPNTFHIEVWRSFADYVARFLNTAASEY